MAISNFFSLENAIESFVATLEPQTKIDAAFWDFNNNFVDFDLPEHIINEAFFDAAFRHYRGQEEMVSEFRKRVMSGEA